MPKYGVNEVLKIIKNLTVREKLELQQSLTSVLGNMLNAAQPAESCSQNIDQFEGLLTASQLEKPNKFKPSTARRK